MGETTPAAMSPCFDEWSKRFDDLLLTNESADGSDYLITNVESEIVTSQWIVDTYSQRNWVERL